MVSWASATFLWGQQKKYFRIKTSKRNSKLEWVWGIKKEEENKIEWKWGNCLKWKIRITEICYW